MGTRSQAGFSMIEMAVSMAVALLLMLGMASFLIESSRLNKSQQMQAEVQANARNCMLMVAQKLRSAGWNPTLGVGQHAQIVEVELQREYEGKGAYPNCNARRTHRSCGRVRVCANH